MMPSTREAMVVRTAPGVPNGLWWGCRGAGDEVLDEVPAGAWFVAGDLSGEGEGRFGREGGCQESPRSTNCRINSSPARCPANIPNPPFKFIRAERVR